MAIEPDVVAHAENQIIQANTYTGTNTTASIYDEEINRNVVIDPVTNPDLYWNVLDTSTIGLEDLAAATNRCTSSNTTYTTSTSDTWSISYQTYTIDDGSANILPEVQRATRMRADDGNWYTVTYEDLVQPVSKEGKEKRRRLQILKRRETRAINERAEALLMRVLDAEEQLEYRRYGSVRVVGSKGSVYEVGRSGVRGSPGRGWSGMLYKIAPDGSADKKLCVHPSFNFPCGDRMVALILALRDNEDAVLKLANEHSMCGREKAQVKLRRRFADAA
jgi:hypothetical protein